MRDFQVQTARRKEGEKEKEANLTTSTNRDRRSIVDSAEQAQDVIKNRVLWRRPKKLVYEREKQIYET